MEVLPKVAIVYLSYHSDDYLSRVTASWRSLNYPADCLGLVVVDNPHPVYGSSAERVREMIEPLIGETVGEAAVLSQAVNRGFSGGNNVGIQWALERGYKYIFLHNQDGFLAPSAMRCLVAELEANPTVGAVQALMLIDNEPHLINSAGNSMHYLGFGFCNQFRTVASAVFAANAPREITYASGAAVLLRAELLHRHGLWDDDFFFYHEDLEYSLRLKFLDYKIKLVPAAQFFHSYQFDRNISKLYYMERNRYAILVMFFKWRTILALFPMMIAMELGLCLFAWQKGWLGEKIRVWRYWLLPRHWRLWLGKRRTVQATRRLTDQQLFAELSPTIVFDDPNVDGWLLRRIGNPLFRLYWRLVKRLIVW